MVRSSPLRKSMRKSRRKSSKMHRSRRKSSKMRKSRRKSRRKSSKMRKSRRRKSKVLSRKKKSQGKFNKRSFVVTPGFLDKTKREWDVAQKFERSAIGNAYNNPEVQDRVREISDENIELLNTYGSEEQKAEFKKWQKGYKAREEKRLDKLYGRSTKY